MTPTDLFFRILPPATSGPNQVQSVVTGAAAGHALFTGLSSDAPKGFVYVCFEAVTNDCYVRFGSVTSSGTTTANGLIVKAGEPGRVFYLSPKAQAFVDVYAPGGAGKLNWQVCSPMGERIDI